MAVKASTLEGTYDEMSKLLGNVLPDFEIKEKSKLVFEINNLKKDVDAIILGHNYMEAALYHGVADIVGDSLQLSREAAATKHNTIIFCGVEFMAETAKILAPNKRVIIPSDKAGCSLASGVTADNVRELKARFPGAPVVTYVNTYADVKAETDICCTSSNAAHIINALPDKEIIFIPDQYLTANVGKETNNTVIFNDQPTPKDYQGKLLIGWRAECEVHEQFKSDDIKRARKQYEGLVVLSHPECPPEVVNDSDFTGSTSQMIKYVKDNDAPNFLLLTECSMADNIIAENKDKNMVQMCSVRCPHMNQITLEDTLAALEGKRLEIELSEDTIEKAKSSLERMLEYG